MVPTLNKDKLFYTPTFVIPAFPIENVERFEEEYLKRIE
jgi:hypothetical protein